MKKATIVAALLIVTSATAGEYVRTPMIGTWYETPQRAGQRTFTDPHVYTFNKICLDGVAYWYRDEYKRGYMAPHYQPGSDRPSTCQEVGFEE
jgi:hypothetical protein